jgi:hypothetical protein
MSPKKKTLTKLKSDKGFTILLVPRTGIEPAQPCDRQILSLLRLPIPPPGPLRTQLRRNIQLFVPEGCNITYFRPIDDKLFKKIFSSIPQ